jgi:hypothetical protein
VRTFVTELPSLHNLAASQSCDVSTRCTHIMADSSTNQSVFAFFADVALVTEQWTSDKAS